MLCLCEQHIASWITQASFIHLQGDEADPRTKVELEALPCKTIVNLMHCALDDPNDSVSSVFFHGDNIPHTPRGVNENIPRIHCKTITISVLQHEPPGVVRNWEEVTGLRSGFAL